jgi:lipid A 3-O-deacylase
MIRSMILCLVCCNQILPAQTLSEKPIPQVAFLQDAKTNRFEKPPSDTISIESKSQRINYLQIGGENDAWVTRQGTDRYYTFGSSVDYFFSKNGLNNNFCKIIFPRITADADNYYGITFRTAMYTPDTVQRARVGDHPYGGIATIGMTCISKQAKTGARLTTEYQLGVVGPASQQEWIQKTAHKLANKSVPIGWEKQIPNDIALNIRFLYEHPLWNYANAMEVVWVGDINAGTMSNNAGVGFRAKLGNFHKNRQEGMPFMDTDFKKKFHYYLSVQPAVYFVADNVMLQGGISLDAVRRKQYIHVDNLERYVGDFALAYHLSYGNFGITYTAHVRTAEFKTGKSMFWGGISFQKRF